MTTGASNDIEKATKIVRAMITQYGMSEKFGLIGLATQQNQYLDGRMVLNCGDATATEIDHEVMKILKESYEQAKELLAANRDAMDEIAAYLIQKETITGKEFMKILREVQGVEEPEEQDGKTVKKEKRIAMKPVEGQEVQDTVNEEKEAVSDMEITPSETDADMNLSAPAAEEDTKVPTSEEKIEEVKEEEAQDAAEDK